MLRPNVSDVGGGGVLHPIHGGGLLHSSWFHDVAFVAIYKRIIILTTILYQS